MYKDGIGPWTMAMTEVCRGCQSTVISSLKTATLRNAFVRFRRLANSSRLVISNRIYRIC